MSLPVGVIGASGRIGSLVSDLCADQGRPFYGVTREVDEIGLDRSPGALDAEGRRAAPQLPILVCTRNDDLGEVVHRVHPSRRMDLVFVQNGMVQPWLADHGLGDCTQGVLYVAVPKVGATPVGGGTSVFHGPWANIVADLFAMGGISAAAVDATAYHREVAVKLAWICVFGLLGQATGDKVGKVATTHASQVRALTLELHPVLARNPGLDLDAESLVQRLLDYGASIPEFPSRLKEWRWRNGWLLEEAARQGITLRLHDEWLARAGGAPGG